MVKDCIRLIVSVSEPHSILAIDARNTEILGYRDKELFGMSVLLLCEPFSITRLETAIAEAFSQADPSKYIEFCDKWGARHGYVTSTSPYFEENGTIASCFLTLHRSSGDIHSNLMSHDSPLRFIWGPDKFVECSGNLKIQAGVETYDLSDAIHARNLIPTVWPRRKQKRSNSDKPLPITITLDTIEAWKHLPQSQAAMCIGVSKTALKQVCRKLGMKKWPYLRLRGPEPIDSQ